MYDLLFGDRDPVAEPGTATGTPGDWWTTFANVPDIFEHAVQGFGVYRSPKRQLDPVLRELGQARAGWAAQSQFVFSQHCKALRRARRVRGAHRGRRATGRAAACFSDLERRVLAFTDCLVSTTAACPTSCSTRCTSELGDVGMLELTYITVALPAARGDDAGRCAWSGTTSTSASSRSPSPETADGGPVGLDIAPPPDQR